MDLGPGALAGLLPAGIAFGIAASLVFARLSDRAAIRRSLNRLVAHLLEFRLFQDEPRLVLRTQRDVLVENGRLLRLLLRPILITALPAFLVLSQVEAFYARAPLIVGEAAVVTVQLDHSMPPDTPALTAPPGIVVETPAVRVPDERQVSWRIRPSKAFAGALRLEWNGRNVLKSVRSGRGVEYLSARRGDFRHLLLHPAERPMRDAGVEWIEVDYPPAVILGWNWLVWFLIASAMGAIPGFLLARRFFSAH